MWTVVGTCPTVGANCTGVVTAVLADVSVGGNICVVTVFTPLFPVKKNVNFYYDRINFLVMTTLANVITDVRHGSVRLLRTVVR